MKKSDCLSILYASANHYRNHFANNNLLFIYREGTRNPQAIETVFLESNFLHLTGVKTHLSPSRFYENCINRRLSLDDFSIKPDGTTEQKMRILPRLLESEHLAARMLGTYIGGRPYLFTDKLIGNVSGAVGFIESNLIYHPNTILEGDIRDNIDKSSQARVLAVYRKPVGDKDYSICVYRAKGVDETRSTELLSLLTNKE